MAWRVNGPRSLGNGSGSGHSDGATSRGEMPFSNPLSNVIGDQYFSAVRARRLPHNNVLPRARAMVECARPKHFGAHRPPLHTPGVLSYNRPDTVSPMTKNNLDTNSRGRACRRLLLLILMVLVSAAHAAAQGAALDWEIVNPFRFISDPAAFDDLRRVYAGLSEKTAANLERELQTLSERDVKRKRDDAERECEREPTGSRRRRCLERAKIPYSGWFAGLAANNHALTCWDSGRRWFRNDGACANYVRPKTHRVRVWAVNPQSVGGGAPRWLAGGTTPVNFEECPDRYPKGTCVEFDARYDTKEKVGTEITAVFPGDGLTLGRATVLVKDILVVGLGDSYASGEGNPDIPARFTDGNVDPDVWYGLKRAPRKDRDSKVGWLDSRCHRSMYSYQFKTALRLALDDPQRAVTYVSFSCSGATTDNIISEGQRAQEGALWNKVEAQLKSLRRALSDAQGTQREIDYLLLSTGGNDAEFAKYVTYVATRGLLGKLAARGVSKESLEKKPGEIKNLLLKDGTHGKYPALHTALLGAEGINIKDCPADKTCGRRILLTTYPDILHDEKGALCQADRGEFDSTFGATTGRAERIEQVNRHILEPLRQVQADPLIASALGWTVVSEHSKHYLKHGFCARNPMSASLTAEKFEMPKRQNGGWLSFDPREYRAYEARRRWIRLPVDAKLTTDQVHLPFLGRFGFDLGFKDDTSNIMHPTAEGHAAAADANVTAIMGVEEKLKRNGAAPGR